MFGFVKRRSRPNGDCTLASFVVNVFCWINFSNAAAFTAIDEQCLVMNVSGSTQSIVNGQYQLDKSFELHCSSQPVWTKTASSAQHSANVTGFTYIYIYYQEDGFDGWIISNTSCYTWGNFIAGISGDSLMPYSNVADGRRTWWETINGTGWTDNPRLTVTCDRFAETEQSTGGARRTALMIALCVVCVFVAVAVFVTAFVFVRRCRKKDKQASLDVAVVSDPSFRYQRVQSHLDDMSRHDVGAGNLFNA